MRISVLLLCVTGVVCTFVQTLNAAETTQQDTLAKSLSFVYAPILGTGYYKAGAETAFVLKIAAENLFPGSAADSRHRWLFPVTLGVRKTDFDAILEEGLPENFHSLSLMPGIAWDFNPHPNWVVVPSLQLGLARDFSIDTTAAIYSANIRALGRWQLQNGTLSWGVRSRAAGQRNLDLKKEQGFVLLESGLDCEFAPSVTMFNKAANWSVYTQLQQFLPDLGVRGISGERIDVETLVHLGISIRLESPMQLFGFSFERAGFALVRGDGLQAISLNLGFPLFRD